MHENRTIRVLRVIPVLDFGGVESLYLTQARHWQTNDIHLEFLTFWKDGHIAEALRDQGVIVHTLNINPSIRNPKATMTLRRFLKAHPFDVVHSAIGEANFHTMLCAPWTRAKILVQEDGIPNRNLRNRLIYAGLYRLTDGIVAVSSASKRYVETQEWAPKNKTHLIHNAIAEDFYHIERATAYAPKRIKFRAVGRLNDVKNFDFLIRVFADVVKTHPHIHLDIVGDGPLRAALERQIHALHAESNVQLIGFCDDLPALHADTDWLLTPSHREGFGLVVAEAMAAGVPVLTSNAGGLPEVLGDLAEDWALDATDTIAWTRRIAEAADYSKKEYEALSRIMRKRAQVFHPTRYIDALDALYRSVLQLDFA